MTPTEHDLKEITLPNLATFCLGTGVLSVAQALLSTRGEMLFASIISHCAIFGHSVPLLSSLEAANELILP